MNKHLTEVERIIAEQQKGEEGTAVWAVGEHLKDIARREPWSAELLAHDLQNEEMSIIEAEKKIKAYADDHKKGGFAVVPPQEADRILRAFYGLRERREEQDLKSGVLRLADLI